MDKRKKTDKKKAGNAEKGTGAKKEAGTKKELYRVMYLFCAMFLLMCGYLSWFLLFESRDVINNPYNLRQENLGKKIVRGNILAADGEILAQTLVTEDGQESRFYPYGEQFAHVVGYSQRGRTGLEQKYNFELLTSDIPFYEKVYREFADLKKPGNQLITTLSVKLQQTLCEAMGDRRGAAVVLEPSTGKLLAMVSVPGFDPNMIATQWDELTGRDNTDSVLINRASQGLYPPGSTFKIVTALEYMRENPSAAEDFTFTCSGIFSYNNAEINCYHGKAHGTLDFTGAFAKSCNGAFASIGSTLSLPEYISLCDSLLFNTELPFPLACEKSSFALTQEAPDWELLQTVIGQGKTEITPLHNALLASAIANGGVLMKPYIVSELQNAYGSSIKKYLPTVYGRLMTAEEAAALTNLMTACVTDGTGHAVQSATYTSAGKTGTAEWEEGKESHAWYIGFAPAENPEIAVSIILEEAGTGSEKAAPIAKKVFDAYFE